MPSIQDFPEKVRFIQKKIINRQLFAMLQKSVEKFMMNNNSKHKKYARIVSEQEIIINISKDICLSFGFEKREVLSNINKKNDPEFFQVHIFIEKHF